MLTYYVVYVKGVGSGPPAGIIVTDAVQGHALIWNHRSDAWQYDPGTGLRFVRSDENWDRIEVVDRVAAEQATRVVTGGLEPLPDEDTINWIFQWRGAPPQEQDYE